MPTPPARWQTYVATFPQTDNYTDIGFDTQYQYQGDNFWLTLRGSYIREYQNWMPASPMACRQSYQYAQRSAGICLARLWQRQSDHLTGQYFNSWGTPDAVCSGPGSLNRFSASLSGVLPGLGCHADGQRVEVGLIGCVAVKARVGPAAIVQQGLRTPTGPFSENCFIIGIHGLGCGWRSTR